MANQQQRVEQVVVNIPVPIIGVIYKNDIGGDGDTYDHSLYCTRQFLIPLIVDDLPSLSPSLDFYTCTKSVTSSSYCLFLPSTVY